MNLFTGIDIRPLTPADQAVLWDMLYHALFVPAGAPPFPSKIVQQPEIARYAAGWGREHDAGFAAVDEISRQTTGAAWFRLLTGAHQGYGYVDDQTPELSIAVKPAWRGQGIGTALLAHLLWAVQPHYQAIALSVTHDNPAIRLYTRLGFEVVNARGDSLTMLRRLASGGA